MPIGLAGRYGTVQAAIVRGDAPLLLSRPALKKLGAVLDFDRGRMCLFSGAVEIDLTSNAAGQYVLDVMDFPKFEAKTVKTEVHMVPTDCPEPSEVPFPGIADEPVDQSKGNKDKFGHNGDKLNNGGDNRDNQVCCPAPSTEGVSCPCPSHSCHAAANIPIRKKDGSLTKKQLRKLGNQVKSATKTPQIGAKYGVVEVFCPPRFVPAVEKMGLRWVETELSQHPPELLVVCLPCTNALHQCWGLVPYQRPSNAHP